MRFGKRRRFLLGRGIGRKRNRLNREAAKIAKIDAKGIQFSCYSNAQAAMAVLDLPGADQPEDFAGLRRGKRAGM